MAKIIARRATLLGLFEDNTNHDDNSYACVALKDSQGRFISMPQDVAPSLTNAITVIDEAAIMSMTSEISSKVIAGIIPSQKYLVVESTGARIPIVPSLDDIVAGLAHTSSVCIVLKEELVLLWSSEPENLLNTASEVEKQLLELVCHRLYRYWELC